MALINRMSRLFKADFNAVLDHIEEPELLLKQSIREMEDELAAAERRNTAKRADLKALDSRRHELKLAIDEMSEQLDLCFAADKDELARNLIRRRLEAERLLNRVSASIAQGEENLDAEQAQLEHNRATLDGLRQKADVVSLQSCTSSSDYDDIGWMSRELSVTDDEVEIAYLRESAKRASS